MATYAIGDVQGCFAALENLIHRIGFTSPKDRLLFVGDLVNRGPESLRVLRYVRSLDSEATTVLGNHDLFLLAAAAGVVPPRPKDTLSDILRAPDRAHLVDWLRQQRLVYRTNQFTMVHAGFLPQWTVEEAELLAAEVEDALQGPDHQRLLRALYTGPRLQWSTALTGMERLVAIATILTRLRICSPAGVVDMDFSGPPSEAPNGYQPWFEVQGRRSRTTTIVCGHWAALGLHLAENLIALDSGCVWGHRLTAVRLEDRKVFQAECHHA